MIVINIRNKKNKIKLTTPFYRILNMMLISILALLTMFSLNNQNKNKIHKVQTIKTEDNLN